MSSLRQPIFHHRDERNGSEAAQPLRLARLGVPEALFLQSMRGWAQGRECWCEVWNDHAKRFGSADGRVLLHLFCRSLAAIRQAARQGIQHHLPCCPYLTTDEARLTAMLHATATGNAPGASFIAHLMLESAKASSVLDAQSALARAYRARGLFFSAASPLARYAEKPLGLA